MTTKDKKTVNTPSIELTDEKMTNNYNVVLYRIRALRNIHGNGFTIDAGTIGGWVESVYLDNGELRLQGDSWILEDGQVWGNAQLRDRALIDAMAQVKDNAVVSGTSVVKGSATVRKNAIIQGHSTVANRAIVSGNAVIQDSLILDETRVDNNARVINSSLMGDTLLLHNASIMRSTIEGHGLMGGYVIVESSEIELGWEDKYLNREVILDSVVHLPFLKSEQ